MTIKRRDFLKRTGLFTSSFVLHASAFMLPTTMVRAQDMPPSSGKSAFPQGVSSADPQPDKVLLWTRVEPTAITGKSTTLTVQVSTDMSFEKVNVERILTATLASDFTVRAVVTGLSPDTTYYYRFISADGVASRTGRTWTAPALDSDRQVNIMFASCQSFPVNQFGAYRRFINDVESGNAVRPDVVLHLGDWIYSLDAKNTEPMVMPDGTVYKGTPEEFGAFGNSFEGHLAYYRRIYRGYMRDSDLQDVMALYPFVILWDDHEYGNDVWQSTIPGTGSNPQQRLAATQAWFEFVPLMLSESLSVPGVPNPAYDFRMTSVEDAKMKDFDDGFMSLEPNNLAAITAVTIYRTIRFGKNVDLIITDTRSYRGPTANPGYTKENIEAENDESSAAFSGFVLYDGPALYTISQGRTANNGNPPAKVTIRGVEYDNPRMDAPPVSMLGLTQKEWFKQVLKNSTARWKVWGNSVPVMAFKFDADQVQPDTGNGYLWTDAWDGFPNEREELLSYILENKIANVISLSGDRHAVGAGLAAVNHDVEDPVYVMPDFMCTSISAFVRAPFVKRPMNRLGLGHLSGYTPEGSKEELCNLNVFMRYGAVAADVMAKTNDLTQALAAAGKSPNPWLKYIENDVHGYGIAKFDSKKVEVDMVAIIDENWDSKAFPEGPNPLRIVRLQTPVWKGGESPKINRVGTIVGQPEHGEPV